MIITDTLDIAFRNLCRRSGISNHTRFNTAGPGSINGRSNKMSNGSIFIYLGELIILEAPQIAMHILQPKEYRYRGCINDTTIRTDYFIVRNTARVTKFYTGTHWKEWVITVMVSPCSPIPISNTRTQATLIQPVTIFLWIIGSLYIMSTENNFK